MAAELGADAVGLVFYAKSPRAVRVEDVHRIVRNLPSNVEVVALFVNPNRQLVDEVINTDLVDLLQFHGEESEQFCRQFSMPYMKAIPVRANSNLAQELSAYSSAKYLLLDSYDPHQAGGTGKTFAWQKAHKLAKDLQTRLILAGGLSAGNVQLAIRSVQPFGVDVSSGVEASKGVKDLHKMKLFIERVRVSDET